MDTYPTKYEYEMDEYYDDYYGIDNYSGEEGFYNNIVSESRENSEPNELLGLFYLLICINHGLRIFYLKIPRSDL